MKVVHTSNGQTRVYVGKYTLQKPYQSRNFGVVPCIVCDEDFVKRSGVQKRCARCAAKYLAAHNGRTLNPGIGRGKATPSGALNWNYTTGIKAYRKLRKEFCEACGGPGQLVHHKDRNRYNNDMGNLVTLCRSCHRKEHKRVRAH